MACVRTRKLQFAGQYTTSRREKLNSSKLACSIIPVPSNSCTTGRKAACTARTTEERHNGPAGHSAGKFRGHCHGLVM